MRAAMDESWSRTSSTVAVPSRSADRQRGLSPDATLAVEIARSAGEFVLSVFRGPSGGARGRIGARRNGAHDVVTPADSAAERLISERLRAERPADGFVGEETGGRDPVGAGLRRVWVVDPIDGTVGFASGLPFFSVSVALLVGDAIETGVVHDPVHRETFVATRGSGAWLLDDTLPRARRRLRVRRLSRMADAVVCADAGDADDLAATDRVARLGAHVRVVRTLGSTALSLAYLAAGRVDGVLQVRGLQAVDIAAGGLLAVESGALVTDASGGLWLDPSDLAHGRGIAAASPSVHRVLLARQARSVGGIG